MLPRTYDLPSKIEATLSIQYQFQRAHRIYQAVMQRYANPIINSESRIRYTLHRPKAFHLTQFERKSQNATSFSCTYKTSTASHGQNNHKLFVIHIHITKPPELNPSNSTKSRKLPNPKVLL